MIRNIVLTIALLVILVPPAHAQWQADGVQFGALVNSDPLDKRRSVADGAGGIIFTWRKFIGPGDTDVYVQRVSPAGSVMWPAAGVPACTAPGNQYSSTVVSDGAGGAIVVWEDQRNGTTDIYAQHVNSAGALLWGSGGMTVCTAADVQYDISADTDGAGGIIISWTDYRNNAAEPDIYAQRISGVGTALWGPFALGFPVCTATQSQWESAITTDDAGGAIIAWQDVRGAGTVYAQRITAAGQTSWAADGVQMGHPGGIPVIDRDGAGGAFIAWSDDRNGTDRDVFVQRVDATGQPLFWIDGVTACAAPNDQDVFDIAFDGTNGAFLVWRDQRSDIGDAYAQYVSMTAEMYWGAAGSGVAAGPDMQLCVSIACDAASNCLFTWYDGRAGNNNRDIYALKTSSGGAQWPEAAVCTAVGQQYGAEIVPDGAGGAIVAWFDARTPGQTDVYAERLDAFGAAYSNVVTNDYDDNTTGTLRAVIRQANTVPGAQTISFNIPGAGPHVITVVNQNLPAITDALTIDGFTQPGAVPNSNPVGSPSNAQMKIVIKNLLQTYGLDFQAPTTLRGVVVNGFNDTCVGVHSPGVIIKGCYIGTDADGLLVGGYPQQYGIRIAANNAIIGGSSPADRVVVGHCYDEGIRIDGAADAKVQGAYIGVGADATTGAHCGIGIRLLNNATNARVGAGVLSLTPNPQERNLIYNNSIGVIVEGTGSIKNMIVGNSLKNSLQCIDLGNNGVSPNDFSDRDGGPNQMLNWPELSSAVGNAISGSMDGPLSATIYLHFYRTWDCCLNAVDFIGATTVVISPITGGAFSYPIPGPIPPGVIINAIATDPTGNTSEVSQPVTYYNTGSGSNSTANLVDANGAVYGTATFANTTVTGNTYITHPYTPPVPVSGYAIGNPGDPQIYFNITTDASYTGGIDVCLNYNENAIPGPEANLVLLHFDGSMWVNVTTSRDLVNNKICGHVTSLSPFVIGAVTTTGVDDTPAPSSFALHANVPNPFNPVTTISYDIPAGGANVNISIYDVSGRLVRELVHEHRQAGVSSVQWNGEDDRGQRVSSGVYFYRMRAGDFVETKKMVLLK